MRILMLIQFVSYLHENSDLGEVQANYSSG